MANMPRCYSDGVDTFLPIKEETPLAPRQRKGTRPPPLHPTDSHRRTESPATGPPPGSAGLPQPRPNAPNYTLDELMAAGDTESEDPWDRDESDAERDAQTNSADTGLDDVARATGGALLISPKKKKSRAIFVDWARSIAVFVVVAVHITISAGRVTTVQPAMQEKIDGTFRLVLQFGMPMFFYFSGRSSAFAKCGFLVFLKGKVLRLILPLAVGMCVIVIPTNYVGRGFRHCTPPGQDNFFVFWVGYWKNFGCNGFDWYWFLPVLFALSVINQPFLFWLKNRYNEVKIAARSDKAKSTTTGGGETEDKPVICCGCFSFSPKKDYPALLTVVLMFGLMAAAAYGLNAPYDVFALAMLPYALLTLVTLFGPLVSRFNLLYLLYLPCPVSSLALACIVMDPYPDPTAFAGQSGVVIMCLFYNFYYIQGYIDTVYDEDWMKWRDAASVHAALKPVALLCLIILIAVCSPTTSEYGGYLFYFPSYKANNYLCVLYILGSWVWLMLWIRYAQTFYNEVLNKFEYTHVTNSSMLVYLVHWFFIDCISVWIILPSRMSTAPAICLLVFGTTLCCALLYVLLVVIASRFRKKKKARRAAASDMTQDDGNHHSVQMGSAKIKDRAD